MKMGGTLNQTKCRFISIDLYYDSIKSLIRATAYRFYRYPSLVTPITLVDNKKCADKRTILWTNQTKGGSFPLVMNVKWKTAFREGASYALNWLIFERQLTMDVQNRPQQRGISENGSNNR